MSFGAGAPGLGTACCTADAPLAAWVEAEPEPPLSETGCVGGAPFGVIPGGAWFGAAFAVCVAARLAAGLPRFGQYFSMWSPSIRLSPSCPQPRGQSSILLEHSASKCFFKSASSSLAPHSLGHVVRGLEGPDPCCWPPFAMPIIPGRPAMLVMAFGIPGIPEIPGIDGMPWGDPIMLGTPVEPAVGMDIIIPFMFMAPMGMPAFGAKFIGELPAGEAFGVIPMGVGC
mmetsp:Transcript_38515/g.83364  ORF Transcript_38515/g.83364 Transcript_38515/m.83364 type:complete len:228 (-) Transcript_38515:236-919(-)